MVTVRQIDQDKIVSLGNTSTITFDDDKRKIIFNFVSAIRKFGRLTPDYTYFVYQTTIEYMDAKKALFDIPYVELNFMRSDTSSNKDIVNKNHVTSISYKAEDLRIIFNMNYGISSKGDRLNEEVISRPIFWNYFSDDEFEADEFVIGNSIESEYIV